MLVTRGANLLRGMQDHCPPSAIVTCVGKMSMNVH